MLVGFKSLSNMPRVRTSQVEDGWVKDEFAETPVMSTYLLAFIVADFQHRETITDGGLKVRDRSITPILFDARSKEEIEGQE